MYASNFQKHIYNFLSADSHDNPPEHTASLEANPAPKHGPKKKKKNTKDEGPLSARVTKQFRNKVYARYVDNDMKDQYNKIILH